MKVNKICDEKPAQAKVSFVVVIAMCTIIIIALIICILMMFRMRKRKQRPFTMTTLVGQNPNTMTVDPNTGNVISTGQVQRQNYMTGQMQPGGPVMITGQAPGNMMLANAHMAQMSGQPGHHMMMQHQHPSQFRMAPIGSASAEFENDFIGVFPHHHLQPCPDM